MQAERAIIAHLCHHYSNDGQITRRQFSDAVYALAGAYDPLGAALLFAQAECTVREHFCEWWYDCDLGCMYRRNSTKKPPWQDGWVRLRWNKAEHEVDQPDNSAHPRIGMPKDARAKVTAQLRRQVFARDGHKCKQCGANPPLELDHIVPVSKGGGSDPENLQSLCVACHRVKGVEIAPVKAEPLP